MKVQKPSGTKEGMNCIQNHKPLVKGTAGRCEHCCSYLLLDYSLQVGPRVDVYGDIDDSS